jgi:hypothetical protein
MTAYAISFYVPEAREKCFLLDIAEDTVVLVRYDLIDRPPAGSTDQGVMLSVLDHTSNLITKRNIAENGTVSFTSQKRGSHKLCLTLLNASWLGSIKRARFKLDIDFTKDEVSHTHLASKEQVSHLEQISENMIDRLAEIIKAQDYARQKEALYKDESEYINSRIIWFTLFQALVILVSGVWQIVSLRRYFVTRKLL